MNEGTKKCKVYAITNDLIIVEKDTNEYVLIPLSVDYRGVHIDTSNKSVFRVRNNAIEAITTDGITVSSL